MTCEKESRISGSLTLESSTFGEVAKGSEYICLETIGKFEILSGRDIARHVSHNIVFMEIRMLMRSESNSIIV